MTNRKSIPLNKGRIEADSEIQRAATAAMAEGRQEEEDYVIAFKSGNKLVAEQLLPRIPQVHNQLPSRQRSSLVVAILC